MMDFGYVTVGWLIVIGLVLLVTNFIQLNIRKDQEIKILVMDKECRRLRRELVTHERRLAQKAKNLQTRLAKKKAEEDVNQ